VNERMESFASAMSGFEPALKGAGVAFGFGIVLSRAIDRSVGHHASLALSPNRATACSKQSLERSSSE